MSSHQTTKHKPSRQYDSWTVHTTDTGNRVVRRSVRKHGNSQIDISSKCCRTVCATLCTPAMYYLFAAAAHRSSCHITAAFIMLAAALLLPGPVVALAPKPQSPADTSFYANLSADKLSWYLRHQKEQLDYSGELAERLVSAEGDPRTDRGTRRLRAEVPVGSLASVGAHVELVDLDELRDLMTGLPDFFREQEAKAGVDGALRLGDAGALRIGYEVTQWQDQGISMYSAMTNFDLGYTLTRSTSVYAGYRLVNFSDIDSNDYQANVAQAKLTLRF